MPGRDVLQWCAKFLMVVEEDIHFLRCRKQLGVIVMDSGQYCYRVGKLRQGPRSWGNFVFSLVSKCSPRFLFAQFGGISCSLCILSIYPFCGTMKMVPWYSIFDFCNPFEIKAS